MPAALRPYWLLAASAFRSRTAYVAAMWASMSANIVFGFIRASVLTSAAAANGGSIAGYSPGQVSGYVWWSQAMLGTIRLWGVTPLERDIKSGQVTVALTRPLSIVGSGLADELGRATFSLIPRVLPVLAVGALLFGLTPPPTVGAAVLGLISVGLAIVLAYLINHCIGALAFWVVSVRGYRLAYQSLGMFLAGLYVPVRMFPGWLRDLTYALPFSSMLQTPTDILVGADPLPTAVLHVAVQVGWVLVVGGLALLMTRAGRKKLEVQGG